MHVYATVWCTGLGGVCSVARVSVLPAGGPHSAHPGLEEEGAQVHICTCIYVTVYAEIGHLSIFNLAMDYENITPDEPS